MFEKQFYLKDKTICDDLIDFFKLNQKNTIPGLTYNSINGKRVDPTVKDSMDLPLYLDTPEPALQRYLNELQKIAERYYKIYPSVNEYASWGMTEGFNIQYYKPGGGYKQWHTENTCRGSCTRHLVWMTYLNDVWIGGGTQFKHPRRTIWARKGKTVIWPADWTYTHRGQVAPFEEKYIVTGWYNWLQ